MKIVFDTNVLISSTLWYNSSSNKLLIKLIKEDAEIFTTTEILEEYIKVLKRDFKYNDEEIKYIIGKLLCFLKIIRPLEKINIIIEDPEDNKILECADSSGSEVILTYDKHLLKLKKYKKILILTPEDFIA